MQFLEVSREQHKQRAHNGVDVASIVLHAHKTNLYRQLPGNDLSVQQVVLHGSADDMTLDNTKRRAQSQDVQWCRCCRHHAPTPQSLPTCAAASECPKD